MNNEFLMGLAGAQLVRNRIAEQFTYADEMTEREQFEAMARAAEQAKPRPHRRSVFLSFLNPEAPRRTVSEF